MSMQYGIQSRERFIKLVENSVSIYLINLEKMRIENMHVLIL